MSSPPGDPGSSYKKTRLNAVRHGLLSVYTVLPWEDEAEYGSLLGALVEEYAPSGPTEDHLIEEIAGVIWRKRRLRLAEAATHQRGLEKTTEPFSNTVGTALVQVKVTAATACELVMSDIFAIYGPFVKQVGRCAATLGIRQSGSS